MRRELNSEATQEEKTMLQAGLYMKKKNEKKKDEIKKWIKKFKVE